MKKKTKQDFQEMLKTEHCENAITYSFVFICVFSKICFFFFQLCLRALKSVNVLLS